MAAHAAMPPLGTGDGAPKMADGTPKTPSKTEERRPAMIMKKRDDKSFMLRTIILTFRVKAADTRAHHETEKGSWKVANCIILSCL